MRPRRQTAFLVPVLAASMAASGCAPVFSDFQSARLAGRHRIEATASGSAVAVSGEEDEPGGHAQDEWGLQVATGISDRVDLRARYVYVEGINVVGFGPKVGLVKDRVALAVPVGFAFGGEVAPDAWAIHPTLLLSQPLSSHVEIDASAKALVPLSSHGGDTLVAFNVGLRLGRLDRFAVHPEIGFLFDPGQPGHFIQLGIGVVLFSRGRSGAP
jgi:hypothetical protein